MKKTIEGKINYKQVVDSGVTLPDFEQSTYIQKRDLKRTSKGNVTVLGHFEREVEGAIHTVEPKWSDLAAMQGMSENPELVFNYDAEKDETTFSGDGMLATCTAGKITWAHPEPEVPAKPVIKTRK